MTAFELCWAFFNVLPGTYRKEDGNREEYIFINEVVYKRNEHSDNIFVYCGLVVRDNSNSGNPRKIVHVRLREVQPIFNSTEPMVTEFFIDPVLKEAFVNKYPVIVKMPSAEETEYSHIDELVIRLNDENEAELYCRFYSMIDLPPVPAEYVKVLASDIEE